MNTAVCHVSNSYGGNQVITTLPDLCQKPQGISAWLQAA